MATLGTIGTATATAAPPASTPPPVYTPGATVRVRKVDAPGHIRTPHYIRGKTGVIERFVGYFLNPEELAYGRSGLPMRALYRVRFVQSHVWPDYDGAAGDTIDIDLYEHWLQAPTP
ncbi:MAG TPA: SH3-like domain-containing protein [Burkholderiales bacterium]|nr:SH3-like domain-containing protein [Burkholderiales bacterium]